MRAPRWIAPVTATLVLLTGCTAGGAKHKSDTTVASDAAPSTAYVPDPVETTIDPVQTTEPAPAETTTAPAPEPTKLRSHDPSLTLIVPTNTIALTCVRPEKLPKLADTNGNDYPRIIFNAMCGSESWANRPALRFGQVGTGEGVECGDEYVINGDEPAGVAWWCPKQKLLLSSPAAIIADYPGDTWKLLRELLIAYALAYVDVKLHRANNFNKAACIIGRTILHLRVNGLLNTGNANAVMDNFTDILEAAKATDLSFQLRNGYNGNGC